MFRYIDLINNCQLINEDRLSIDRVQDAFYRFGEDLWRGWAMGRRGDVREVRWHGPRHRPGRWQHDGRWVHRELRGWYHEVKSWLGPSRMFIQCYTDRASCSSVTRWRSRHFSQSESPGCPPWAAGVRTPRLSSSSSKDAWSCVRIYQCEFLCTLSKYLSFSILHILLF